MSGTSFISDTFATPSPKFRATCIRQLSIIGEAVGHLSDELREEAPSVPWTDIYGMRNKLVHDYFGVDLEAVWDTVQQGLPSLLTAVNVLLGGQENS